MIDLRFVHNGTQHTYSFTPTEHEWVCTFLSEGARFDLNYIPEQSRIFVYRVEEKDGFLTTTYDKPICQIDLDTDLDKPIFVLDTEEYMANLPAEVDSLPMADYAHGLNDMGSDTPDSVDTMRKLKWVAENVLYWYPEISPRLSDAENAVFQIIVDKARTALNYEVNG